MPRVARRALVLAAVVLRALTEPPDADERDAKRARLHEWFKRNRLDEEAEEAEARLITAPLGTLSRRDMIDGSWRAEGLAVLADRLGAARLPPHDVLADPYEIALRLGVFDDTSPPWVLDHQPAADAVALERLGRQLLGIHWRLDELRLNRGSMNFRAFARKSWVGSFELDDEVFVDNDLVIGGKAVAHADPDLVRTALSIARERHHAVNWLLGDDPMYSKIDIST